MRDIIEAKITTMYSKNDTTGANKNIGYELSDLTKVSNQIKSAYALKGLKINLQNFITSGDDGLNAAS